jgi:hypothetical protein
VSNYWKVFIVSMYVCFGIAIIMNSYWIGEFSRQQSSSLLESTDFITVTDKIVIVVPEDLTERKAEWIAKLCKMVNKPVVVKSPIGMEFDRAERYMRKALEGS